MADKFEKFTERKVLTQLRKKRSVSTTTTLAPSICCWVWFEGDGSPHVS